MLRAVLAGMASNGAISAINNRGNLSTVLKDVTSSDAMKGYVVSGVTAGLTAGVYDKWTGTQTGTSTALPNSGAVATVSPLSTWQGVGQFTANQVLQNGTSLLVDRALGGEARLGDALQSSLANAFAAYGFNLVGDISKNRFAEGGITKIGLHALMGGLAAEASGGDFRTGALAAGVNEALLDSLAKNYADMPDDQKKGLLVMNSQLLGVLAASVQSNADAESLQTGAWVAKNATQYNYLGDHQKAQRAKELEESKDSLETLRINTKWELIDAGQDASFAGGAVVGVPEGLLDTVKGILEVAVSPIETYQALRSVLESGDVLGNVSDAVKQSYIARIDNLEAEYERAGAGGSFNAGRETGKLISDVVALGTGVGGALKSGALLVEKVTAKVVKVELTGAKATGTAGKEIPATSPIAKEGLKNDLAAQAGIPRDIVGKPSSIWGKSIDDVKQSLVLDGATVIPKPALSGTSGKAQAYTVEGHASVKEVQYHPGGGTHGSGDYYKLGLKDGTEIRVIDPSIRFSPGTITKNQKYFDPNGVRLKYEGGQWKPWE
ncbi:DUF637 domain-containing protein [Pseudomonas sp. FJ2-5-13]|uniref:DUF637 domain-containing protein n=1 Tax=Pseudomonas sp. FJ2-5-13 TaxID=2976884 RepID=UPI0031F31DDD